MMEFRSPTEQAIELMRLYFPLLEEERVAVSLIGFLGPRAGARIQELRPETAMVEVLELSGANNWTTAEICRLLELAGIEAFDDQFGQMTFREFVRYAAGLRLNHGEQETGGGKK